MPGTTRVVLLDINVEQVAQHDEPRPQVIVAPVERSEAPDRPGSVEGAEEAP